MATGTDPTEPAEVPSQRQVRRRSLLVGTVAATVAVAAATGAALVAGGLRDDERTTLPEPEAEIRFLPEDDESAQPLVADDRTGEPAPGDPFPLLDGGLGTFAELKGTPVVVNFFASWCQPCRDEMPDFAAVHDEVGADVRFVGVNVTDGEAEARRLLEETGVDYTVARDPSGSLSEAFGVVNMPSTFLLDAEGRIASSHPGALTADELRSEIAAVS